MAFSVCARLHKNAYSATVPRRQTVYQKRSSQFHNLPIENSALSCPSVLSESSCLPLRRTFCVADLPFRMSLMPVLRLRLTSIFRQRKLHRYHDLSNKNITPVLDRMLRLITLGALLSVGSQIRRCRPEPTPLKTQYCLFGA